MTGVRRVAIIGAECVGKTELAQRLADSLPGRWIPEYLREFCDRMQRTPAPREQWHILAEQQRREEEALALARASGLRWVLADSAPLLTAVYSELLFADVSLYEQALAHHARYDATLLLLPDLPWVADGIQRDGPAVREASHALLLARLAQFGLRYAPVAGSGGTRIATALAALQGLQSPSHARGPEEIRRA
jgi:nicotinamide riboside kinase